MALHTTLGHQRRTNTAYHRRSGAVRIGTAYCGACGHTFPLWATPARFGLRYAGLDRLLGHQMRDHGGVAGIRLGMVKRLAALAGRP